MKRVRGESYSKIVRIDARKFKERWEHDHQGEKLDWNPGRMERLKGIEAYDSYPLVCIDWKGDPDITDGRHRIATAAMRGLKIDVATPPKDNLPPEILAEGN